MGLGTPPRAMLLAGLVCGDLDFRHEYSHLGCGLRAHILDTNQADNGINYWDGGVSAAPRGWGKNGYKTNNNVNCGSDCVIDCTKNDGVAAGYSSDQIWIR